MPWGALVSKVDEARRVGSFAEERNGAAEDQGIYVEGATLAGAYDPR